MSVPMIPEISVRLWLLTSTKLTHSTVVAAPGSGSLLPAAQRLELLPGTSADEDSTSIFWDLTSKKLRINQQKWIKMVFSNGNDGFNQPKL